MLRGETHRPAYRAVQVSHFSFIFLIRSNVCITLSSLIDFFCRMCYIVTWEDYFPEKRCRLAPFWQVGCRFYYFSIILVDCIIIRRFIPKGKRISDFDADYISGIEIWSIAIYGRKKLKNFEKSACNTVLVCAKIENVKRTGKAVTPKGGEHMTDYELIMIGLTFSSLILTLLIAYIKK